MSSSPPKILAFAGSLKRQSYNKRLAEAAASMARDAGAKVTTMDLFAYPLPQFDEDLEGSQIPSNVALLREIFIANDSLIISSPEYNGSFSGVLKNVLDWVSRPATGAPALAGFRNKLATVLCATPGHGGQLGLSHLAATLEYMGVLVLPNRVILGNAETAFGSRGELLDERLELRVRNVIEDLVEKTSRLKT